MRMLLAKEEFYNLDSLGTPGDWTKFFATGTFFTGFLVTFTSH